MLSQSFRVQKNHLRIFITHRFGGQRSYTKSCIVKRYLSTPDNRWFLDSSLRSKILSKYFVWNFYLNKQITLPSMAPQCYSVKKNVFKKSNFQKLTQNIYCFRDFFFPPLSKPYFLQAYFKFLQLNKVSIPRSFWFFETNSNRTMKQTWKN